MNGVRTLAEMAFSAPDALREELIVRIDQHLADAWGLNRLDFLSLRHK